VVPEDWSTVLRSALCVASRKQGNGKEERNKRSRTKQPNNCYDAEHCNVVRIALQHVPLSAPRQILFQDRHANAMKDTHISMNVFNEIYVSGSSLNACRAGCGEKKRITARDIGTHGQEEICSRINTFAKPPFDNPLFHIQFPSFSCEVISETIRGMAGYLNF
jgi:hypothetical protein